MNQRSFVPIATTLLLLYFEIRDTTRATGPRLHVPPRTDLDLSREGSFVPVTWLVHGSCIKRKCTAGNVSPPQPGFRSSISRYKLPFYVRFIFVSNYPGTPRSLPCHERARTVKDRIRCVIGNKRRLHYHFCIHPSAATLRFFLFSRCRRSTFLSWRTKSSADQQVHIPWDSPVLNKGPPGEDDASV